MILVFLLIGIGIYFLIELNDTEISGSNEVNKSGYIITGDIGDFKYQKIEEFNFDESNRNFPGINYSTYKGFYSIDNGESVYAQVYVFSNLEEANEFLNLILDRSKSYQFVLRKFGEKEVYEATNDIDDNYRFSIWVDENKIVNVVEPKTHTEIFETYFSKYP